MSARKARPGDVARQSGLARRRVVEELWVERFSSCVEAVGPARARELLERAIANAAGEGRVIVAAPPRPAPPRPPDAPFSAILAGFLRRFARTLRRGKV